MIKFQMIGYVGKDSVVQQHGTDSVINFSICHTDKYKDASGQKYEKATWVNCSYWVERTTIAQYIKKGTLLWVEGVVEAKLWKGKNDEPKAFLNLRVYSVQLLGGGQRDDNSSQSNSSQTATVPQDGYKPVDTGGDFSDLPF